MPIGKNALKRVSNNGYSAVKSTAPDMENSEIEVVAEAKSPEKKEAPVKKSDPKAKTAEKSAKKTAEKKSEPEKKAKTEKKAPAKPKTEKPIDEKKSVAEDSVSHPDGFVRTALGDDMPVYLL